MSTIELTDPLIGSQFNTGIQDLNKIRNSEKEKYGNVFNAVGATFSGLGAVALLTENVDLAGNWDMKTVGALSLIYAAESFFFSYIIKK